ncbi:hypothetical protein PFICI_06600 [Pestalotiopsis fici W106-1]|uniref:SNF2 N-terminal domain-containing protein n=1 Tax=Pestalotiopsis fici (strain W106-1 / CGMCC3.15140) TaxID=1229662 RepID=W3X650_PESFW|nr:uncharacterized protein PFICI_06600 [Pestalotiopsis fici W106-1]ETS81598.1 hypothetical protein PFICI_06600 [Pestalotiopsis fici W106-1]
MELVLSPPVQNLARLWRATSLDAQVPECHEDNRILAEMNIPGGLDPNHLLTRIAWLCDGGDKFVTIDKKDHGSFFRSIPFAIPSIIRSMNPLSTQTIRVELCEPCSPKFPDVYWICETEGGVLQPIHKPDDVGRYEDGLRKQAPALEIAARVPPHDRESKKERPFMYVRLSLNTSRIAHRALSCLPSIDGALADLASPIVLKAFTEPGHSDSLVFNLKPFSESIPTLPSRLGQEQAQPPHFPPSLRLDPKQLSTVKYMIDRENSPQAFTEREDEEEVMDGLPLRAVGRAEREVYCAGGIIADKVGAGKTVMTLALIDLQANHDDSGYKRRAEQEASLGAKALKATLIIVPEHIIDQWQNEAWRFLRNLAADDLLVLRSPKDLTLFVNQKRIRNAKVVIVNDSLFGDNQYREELAKSSARSVITGTSRADSTKLPYPERTYVEWHRACVRNLRTFLSAYLESGANEHARKGLVRTMEGAYSDFQAENRDLVAEHVKESSRWAVPGQKTKKAASTGNTKPRKLNYSKMFFDAYILFEYFSWSRIVWDEVSYRNIHVAQFLSTAKTEHKWLLSGTPPRQTLADINYMATALGISLVRPIDLRLGLPAITNGPTLSVRTQAEDCLSYGRLKSDKFVKDRHEQAEHFLRTFSISNNAAGLNVQVHEHVIVCAPSQEEKAVYLETQQVWRRAQMNQDYLDKENLGIALHAVGITPGSVIPDDLSSKALSYAASLPTFGRDGNRTHLQLTENRQEVLENTKKYIGQLFRLLLWLARRLEKCSTAKGKGKRSKETDDSAAVIEPLLRIIRRLQKGDVRSFGGSYPYMVLVHALMPDVDDKIKADFVRKASQCMGSFDLAQLQKGKVVFTSSVEDRSLLKNFYENEKILWTDFYRLEPIQLDDMSEDDVTDLITEYMSRNNDQGPEEISSYIDNAKDYELRDKLQQLFPEIEDKQNARRATSIDGKKNIEQEQAILSKKTNQELEAEARVRGLKCSKPIKKAEVLQLIKAHEEGGAGYKNYENCTDPRALMPFGPPPMLGSMVRVRGANVSATENAFKEAINLFVDAIQLLETHGNQVQRAKLFQRVNSNWDFECFRCGSKDDLTANLLCAHVMCRSCIADKEYCGDGHERTTGCRSIIEGNVVDLAKLFTERRDFAQTEQRLPNVRRNYSSKVNCVIDLIQRTPADEKVVVFTQYTDLIKELLDAMKHNSITARTTTNLPGISSVSCRASGTVEAFQDDQFRVLILKVDAPEAAGSNLVVANHVIFATPLATKAQDNYDSCMEQAKGRCARRGQTKDVHYYHCVVDGTIEVDMLEARTNKRVLVQPGQCLGELVPIPGCCSGLGSCGDAECQKTRVNSLLRPPEIWKALGEVDYATMAALGQSSTVKDATVGRNDLTMSNDGDAMDVDTDADTDVEMSERTAGEEVPDNAQFVLQRQVSTYGGLTALDVARILADN